MVTNANHRVDITPELETLIVCACTSPTHQGPLDAPTCRGCAGVRWYADMRPPMRFAQRRKCTSHIARVHNNAHQVSTTHKTLAQTEATWEAGYECDPTFHTKWSEDKDVMNLTLAYQRQQKVFQLHEEQKAAGK